MSIKDNNMLWPVTPGIPNVIHSQTIYVVCRIDEHDNRIHIMVTTSRDEAEDCNIPGREVIEEWENGELSFDYHPRKWSFIKVLNRNVGGPVPVSGWFVQLLCEKHRDRCRPITKESRNRIDIITSLLLAGF